MQYVNEFDARVFLSVIGSCQRPIDRSWGMVRHLVVNRTWSSIEMAWLNGWKATLNSPIQCVFKAIAEMSNYFFLFAVVIGRDKMLETIFILCVAMLANRKTKERKNGRDQVRFNKITTSILDIGWIDWYQRTHFRQTHWKLARLCVILDRLIDLMQIQNQWPAFRFIL